MCIRDRLMGDKNAVAVGDVQLQLLEGCAGSADAFAHIHDEMCIRDSSKDEWPLFSTSRAKAAKSPATRASLWARVRAFSSRCV